MSAITRLSSVGSAGFRQLNDRANNWENQKRINLFKVNGLYPMFLKLKLGNAGYILPAFDSTLHLQDSSRPTSVGAYRDINRIDTEAMLPELTDWVVFVDGYTYYGKSMSTFASPTNIGAVDPIIELRKEVYRRRRQGDESLMHLVQLPKNATMQDKIILPGAATLALMNVWATGNNEREQDFAQYKNRVLCLKVTAWSVLKEALNEMRPATIATPRDPNWPNFLLGDVTNPMAAVRWNSTEYQDKNGFRSAVLNFGHYSMQPGSMERVFNCHTEQLPVEALAGRYDLADIQNVLHIPTSEEVAELLIEEDQVPYDLLAEVCEGKVNLPKPKRLVKTAAETAPAPQPAVQPQFSQPALTPTPAAVPNYNKHPWAQDDPTDNIPMDPAPAQAAMPAPAATSNALTPAEHAELQELIARLSSKSGTIELSAQEAIRLNTLRMKLNS